MSVETEVVSRVLGVLKDQAQELEVGRRDRLRKIGVEIVNRLTRNYLSECPQIPKISAINSFMVTRPQFITRLWTNGPMAKIYP